MTPLDERVLRNHIATLEHENERLRAQLTALTQAARSADDLEVPLEWGLSASQATVMRALLSRPFCSKATLMTALYSANKRARDRDPKIVDVFIAHLRAKAPLHGVRIRTRWGQGHYIAHDERLALRERLKQHGGDMGTKAGE